MFTQTALTLPSATRAMRPWRAPGRLQAYAAICAVSFLCYIASRLAGGAAETLFSIVGVGACGWAWLLTRALFDPAERDVRWPRIVAVVLAATGALGVMAPDAGGLGRFADSVYALSGSAALLLTFVEPLQGRWSDIEPSEKRFRVVFLAAYSLIVAVAVLALRIFGSIETHQDDLIKGGCAAIGLLAGSAAVWFRLRHPLVRAAASSPARRAPTAEETRLAGRLLDLLRDEAIDAEPELRIGDVAARLGQPEYKVSQCISTALGFANFNRLINHHRIERAKRLLAGEGRDRPILVIAFECGFGSVGPFNRAFKDEVGMTPRAFRAASRRLTDSSSPAQDDH